MKKFIRNCLIFSAILVAIFIALWIADKFDNRTPEQIREEAQARKIKIINELKQDFPSMEVDGKVVRVDVEWRSQELLVIFPKTFGFGATRFVNKGIIISK